jgi:hypothetical protein
MLAVRSQTRQWTVTGIIKNLTIAGAHVHSLRDMAEKPLRLGEGSPIGQVKSAATADDITTMARQAGTVPLTAGVAMDLPTAAAYAGVPIAVLARAIHTRDIPCTVAPGGCLHLERAALERWVEQSAVLRR